MSKPREWNVRVDWTRTVTYNEADLEEILEQLADLHPALGVDEANEPEYQSRYSATLTLPATSLRQAVATGLRRVEDATGEKANGVEALTQREAERRLAEPQIPELVGHAEIADMLGVSRQRAAQLAERPGFPPAVVTTKTGPLRVKSQVEAWVTTWDRKGGRPKKQTREE